MSIVFNTDLHAVVIDKISPVAFSVFGLPVRWYALAYVAGFILGFWLLKKLTKKDDSEICLTKKQLDDLLTFLVFGVIIGGRLGYVLFYNLSLLWHNPLEVLAVWHGGMSFHGGLLGVIIATLLFVRKQSFPDKSVVRNSLRVLDLLAVVAPIGLGLGRLANFINMELLGRKIEASANAPWGVIFKDVGPQYPRYPSPLYEAALEGLALFLILWLLYRKTNLRHHPGAISGALCIFYGIFRIFCEQFRQPDIQIGTNGFMNLCGLDFTMGQLLSGVMILVGIIIFTIALRKHKPQV